MKNIPITRPVFNEKDKQAILEPLKTGWVVQGPKVKEFEQIFADFVKAKYAIATTSCTTALHIALISAGIKTGDEVVLPSFTFAATANVIEYIGAKPIFCDIDLDTFNIDTVHLEQLIKKHKKIKAIIPVNLFGLCANMYPIMKLSKKYNLKITEDSACALGSSYYGKPAGTFGLAGCFSFHPRKAITTGEGGMVTTNNEKIANLCRMLRDHGASKSDIQRHIEKGGSLLPEYNLLGYNYRMTDIQASLGISQMDKADEIIKKRISKAQQYNQLLNNIKYLKTPTVPDGHLHAYQSYVCMIEKREFNNNLKKANIFRNKLMTKLEEKGVSTRQGTHAVHTLGYYKTKYKLQDEQLPNSLEADRLSITLPLYSQMTEDEQKYVVEQIKEIGKK